MIPFSRNGNAPDGRPRDGRRPSRWRSSRRSPSRRDRTDARCRCTSRRDRCDPRGSSRCSLSPTPSSTSVILSASCTCTCTPAPSSCSPCPLDGHADEHVSRQTDGRAEGAHEDHVRADGTAADSRYDDAVCRFGGQSTDTSSCGTSVSSIPSSAKRVRRAGSERRGREEERKRGGGCNERERTNAEGDSRELVTHLLSSLRLVTTAARTKRSSRPSSHLRPVVSLLSNESSPPPTSRSLNCFPIFSTETKKED